MAGPKTLIPIDQYEHLKSRSRGYVPHWEIAGATYFVTYRLHDSLPRHVIEKLRQEHKASSGAIFAIALDRELDEARGAAHLRENEIAAVVAENLNHFAGERYELAAWCVMPNHVHVIVRPMTESLSSIVHSWKSYTAHRVARILGVARFWAREYYDRIIRNERDLANTIAYVRNNPTKARLTNWPWIG